MRVLVTTFMLLGLSFSLMAADSPAGTAGDAVANELKSRIDKTLADFNKDLGKIRSGRPSMDMVNSIMVARSDGTRTPLSSIASLTAPEARVIVVKPNDRTMLKDIEKGIREAGLGITPVNTGSVIRLEFPAISQERQKAITKQIRQKGEQTKLAIKNQGREANDRLSQLLKDSKITADEHKRASALAQKEIDTGITKIDQSMSKKEKEILEN